MIDPNATPVWNGLTQNQLRMLATSSYIPASDASIRDLVMKDPVFKGLVDSGKLRLTEQDIEHAATGGETPQGAWTEKRWTYEPTIPLPKMPSGYNLAVDKEHGYDTGGTWYGGANLGPMVYDPVWGAVRTATTKRDVMDRLAPALATAMFMIPTAGTLGPLLANSLGVSPGIGSSLVKGTAGMIGSAGRNIGSVLGSIFGGASGLPFGSTLGNIAGGMAQSAFRSPQQMPVQRTAQSQLTPQQAYLLLALLSRRG